MDLPGLSDLVDELDEAGNGVIMTVGKGGVGKTTLAAAIAIALVDRGHEVILSTTDPAAHLTDALADAAPDGLLVERIDPAVETARYTAEVLAAASGLEEEGLSLFRQASVAVGGTDRGEAALDCRTGPVFVRSAKATCLSPSRQLNN